MAEVIAVYDKDSKEYKRIEAAGKLIEAEVGCPIKVEDIYFDFGQNWKWTTLVAYPVSVGSMSYQCLCPRDYKKIVAGDIDEFMDAVKTVIKEGRW